MSFEPTVHKSPVRKVHVNKQTLNFALISLHVVIIRNDYNCFSLVIMEKNEKKYRQRNKQRRNAIRQQLEFYFSDSNLSKDRYLSQLIKNSPDSCKFRDFYFFLSRNINFFFFFSRRRNRRVFKIQ